MTRRHRVTDLLLFVLMPSLLAMAGAQSSTPASGHASEIERIELQFLSAKSADQRKKLVAELKSLDRLPQDAAVLNTAVNAMLPQADSAEQAELLLELAAANPAGAQPGASDLAAGREFLVDAREVAARARRPIGDVEMLADIRVDHLRKDSLGRDGLTTSLAQQIWRINTADGAASFSPHSIMYAAMSERLELLRARVLKRNGSVVEARVFADQPVIEHSSSMYFDSRSRDLHFAPLEPGDLVEVEYLLLPATELNPWAGYYARLDLFRDGLATALRRRVVIAPSGLKLYAVTQGLAPAVVRRSGEESIRIWEARAIPAQPAEPLSPGASSTGPYLHISTIASAQEFGRWYSGLLEPGMKLDEGLQAEADQILARKLSTAGKVQAVYELVQRGTHYVAFEFGVHSYQPYPVSTVERRGFGDCKDKAAMIVALLRAVGVEAEFAMVRTRSAGGVAPDAYSVQLFNHAVAYVPELDLYLDGTAEYASPGELPPDDQGAMAITVDAEGRAYRRTIPFAAPQTNRVMREVRARLTADGRVEFTAQTRLSGYYAAEQRRSCESNDLAGSYRESLAQFYPRVKIGHAVAEGTARASQEVELEIEGSLEAVQGAGEVTLRSSLGSAGLAKKYASRRMRRNPELVPVTPSEHELFDYELPEGARAILPEDTTLLTPFGRVKVSYRRAGRKLQVETYTELIPQTVSAADYPAFRAFCRAADEALRRQVRIVLP
jgi:transglutaminase-like putative cysteine protease